MNNRQWSRRRLLQLIGASATAGITGCTGSNDGDTPTPTDTVLSTAQSAETATDTEVETTTAPTGDPPSTFVERDGTDFVVDGNRFVFSGVANCCLAEGYTSRDRVDDVLVGASNLDADVIRFKAGSAGGSSTCGEAVDGCDLSFQPEPGSFNETAFEHLDYIVDEAGKRGMRVILPLVDNWGSRGMKQYIAWSDTANAHDEFYTDDRVNKLYRGFVEHLLTRTNSITGREYRADPTILMWELANEPRVQTNYSGFSRGLRIQPASSMNWTGTIWSPPAVMYTSRNGTKRSIPSTVSMPVRFISGRRTGVIQRLLKRSGRNTSKTGFSAATSRSENRCISVNTVGV